MSSIKLHWSKLLQGMFCLLLAGGPAAAQTVTGTISGTVVDTSDNAIVGATVTIINVKTGDKRTAVTMNQEDSAFRRSNQTFTRSR